MGNDTHIEKNEDRIENLRDLIPSLQQQHSTTHAPDLFKAWLEDLIEAKKTKETSSTSRPNSPFRG